MSINQDHVGFPKTIKLCFPVILLYGSLKDAYPQKHCSRTLKRNQAKFQKLSFAVNKLNMDDQNNKLISDPFNKRDDRMSTLSLEICPLCKQHKNSVTIYQTPTGVRCHYSHIIHEHQEHLRI